MPIKTQMGIFAASWVLVGFIHLLPTIAGSTNGLAIPLWIGFTLLTFPLRSFLLKNVLNLELEAWMKTTVKAALRGVGAAVCTAIVVGLILQLTINPDVYTSTNIYILVGYIAFRLTVLWWQYRHIEKHNLNWLYFNLGGIGLYTLVLIGLLQTISVYYGDYVMPFLGIILSELAVSFSYINLKLSEDQLQKRKVDEPVVKIG